MKARNKITGKVFRHFTISSEYGTATGIDENNILRIFTPADGAFEIIEEPSNTHGVLMELPDPWQEFRCKAAKDFLAASIQHSGFCGNPKDDNHISRAIQYADELIEQLKERDEHNNSK